MNSRPGPEPEMRACFGCGSYEVKERMSTIDISRDDEYYPKIRYLCWDCSGGTEEEKR